MKFNGEIHPVADLFPMLPDDELADLAADIKVRGQLQPIVLDSDGRILDGRNRFQACKLAKVEPEFVTYDGDDPNGYALAVNVARRHMTKSQQAIVVAGALSNLDTQGDAAKRFGIHQSRIAEAKVIIENSADGDLAEAVLARTKTFDKALILAKERREKKLNEAEQMAVLREEAPDLADAVAEETLSLEDAQKVLDERHEDAGRAERVAEIDALLAGRKKSFAERAQSEELTWEEAEQLAIQAKREFHEAASRNIQRINDVIGGGWLALQDVLENPNDQFTKTIKDGLTEHALKSIAEIQTSIIAIARTLEGSK